MQTKVPEKIQKTLDALLLQSPCKKRKVAAVITDKDNFELAYGFNIDHDAEDGCGNELDKNRPGLVHAEIAALEELAVSDLTFKPEASKIYITHPPCENCAKEIKKAGIQEVIISDQFMKFDTGKLRYSLIPPEATKALAEVLTYGAKKYKPNNWREVDDTSRYWDALYRHLEAARNGEELDEESGLDHLKHAITNIAFLIALK